MITAMFIATITFQAFRNLLSKSISGTKFGTKEFYLLQSAIFAVGTVILGIVSGFKAPISPLILFSLMYSVFLLSAQWCYTMALGKIKVSICSTVYSLGFIIPTISGSIFWKEEFTVFDAIGTLLVVAVIIISGMGKEGGTKEKPPKMFFVSLVIAMLSSGGLGLLQKVLNTIPSEYENSSFIFTSFTMAAIISFVFSLFAKKDTVSPKGKTYIFAGLTGGFFAACNILNTALAGKLDSGFFFPLQNISVILITVVLGCTVMKEKFTKKALAVLVLGALAVIMLSI